MKASVLPPPSAVRRFLNPSLLLGSCALFLLSGCELPIPMLEPREQYAWRDHGYDYAADARSLSNERYDGGASSSGRASKGSKSGADHGKTGSSSKASTSSASASDTPSSSSDAVSQRESGSDSSSGKSDGDSSKSDDSDKGGSSSNSGGGGVMGRERN